MLNLSIIGTKEEFWVENLNKEKIFCISNASLSTKPEFLFIEISFKKLIPVAIGPLIDEKTEIDKIVTINISEWDIDKELIAQGFVSLFEDAKLSVINHYPQVKIPANLSRTINEKIGEILEKLALFGFSFIKEKPKSAKAQHRWDKDVAKIDFYVDYNDARAIVRWHKRNEMLIKKGAVLKPDIPLNKDGSIGFAAKFTLQLREMNKDKIRDFVTTDDIYLKSVNEVGNFLYFAGTNSWLVLKDQSGKTIEDYTII